MRRLDGAAALDASQESAADRGLKALVPIGGRPFLDYVLSGLADAGIADVVVVIGPSSLAIRGHYESSPPGRLHLSFATQAAPRGTADALLAAEPSLGAEDFLVLNSDNLYPASALRRLHALGRPGLPVFERESLLQHGNFPPERVARFAVLVLRRNGFLERIVEKPAPEELAAAGGEILLSMNLWRFSPSIFEACRRAAPSSRGERELPQAVDLGMARLGMQFATFRCDEGVLDLSARSDIAAVAGRLRGVEARP